MPRSRQEFTQQEKLFIEAYTAFGMPTFANGTQSATKAGFSENSARQYAYEMLKKPYIRRAIDKELKKLKDYHIQPDEILARLSQMSRADLSQFYDVTDLSQLKDKELSFLVKKIIKKRFTRKDGTVEETFEFELHDSKDAMKELNKIYKLVNDYQTRINVDYSKLSDDQLQRLANGEDILDVLLPNKS
jgi:hypothetical protein